MKYTFRSLFQIRVIFLGVTLFLMALSFFVFKQVERLIESSHGVNRSTEVALELETLMGCIKDAEAGHRGYLLTHDSSFLETFHRGVREYPKHLKNARLLTAGNAAQQNTLREVQQIIERRIGHMEKLLEIDKTRRPSTFEFRMGKWIMDSLRDQINTISNAEGKVLNQRTQFFRKQSIITPAFLLVISLGALAILFVSYNKINSELARSKRLQRNQQLMVMEAPAIICMMRGPEHIYEMANEQYIKLIGQRDILGKPIRKALPELEGQGFFDLLDEVYKTGKSYTGKEALLKVNRINNTPENVYINFVYRASVNEAGEIEGILVYGSDVTEQVSARKKVEESEEQLRIAVEGGELGMFDYYPETGKLVWSAKTKEMFGLSPDAEIDYATYVKALHPDDKENLKVVTDTINHPEGGGMYDLEYRVVGINDGKLKWIRSKGKATFSVDGKPIRFTGVTQDITQRRLAEEILRESEKRFRMLAETLPQLVWVTDEKGIQEYTSHRWEEYSGVKPGGEKEWKQVVHPDDYDNINKTWANSLATGTTYRCDVRLKSKAGDYHWHAAYGEPIFDSENKILKWVGSFTDVQDEKEFSQLLEIQVRERTHELAVKNSELEKMNKELESFTYVSSHDLQEPLRKIQTFSTRILEKESDNLSENGKDYFKRMQAAAGRMQRLIEDLLAFSRASTGDRVFEKTRLNTLISEVETELKETISEKQAVIEVAELCEVKIIPFQFRQLMYNLIGNALKFSKADAPPRIRIDSEKILLSKFQLTKAALDNLPPALVITGKDYCHIRVSDNGIGFEPRFRDRIFEVFQRLHGRNEYAGTGIGLAIVKKIIDNHEGFITANGEVNEGATFDIYIPCDSTT